MTTLYRNYPARFLYILFGLAFALSHSPVEAQRHTPPSLPVPLPIAPITDPTPTPTPLPVAEFGPTATITFADATKIKAQASDLGRFPLVGLRPREVISITVEFPVSLASNSVTAQPLDGGRIIAASKDSGRSIGASSIRFQIGDQPGLYRVLIAGGGPASTLQFWVADAKNPKNNRPVINPGH